MHVLLTSFFAVLLCGSAELEERHGPSVAAISRFSPARPFAEV